MTGFLTSGPNATLQPRMRHEGPNFMDGAAIGTTTVTVSDTFQLFQLPDPTFVIRGVIKASQKTGVSGATTLKLGTSKGDATFGTYTVCGATLLRANLTFFGPITLSSSGGAFSTSNPQFWPVIATASATATATKSLSLYVMMEYVQVGNIGGGIGSGPLGGGQQGL